MLDRQGSDPIALVNGKVGREWKNLTAMEGVFGHDDACGQFSVLESQHSGFHDVCLSNQCSAAFYRNPKWGSGMSSHDLAI